MAPDWSSRIPGFGSGSDSSLYDSLTRNDGQGVNVGSLAAFVLGLITTAFGTGSAKLITTLFSNYVIEPLRQIAGFVRVQAGLFGVWGQAFSVSWATTAQWVTQWGPLAFPAATVIVVLTAYLVYRGWSLNG